MHPEAYERAGRGANLEQITPYDRSTDAPEPEFEAQQKADMERFAHERVEREKEMIQDKIK